MTLEDFLFKGRSANCEYFATAGVALMRAAGIPARLVSGFMSDDWNEYGKFFDVRQSDAHAWVEAYLPGRGWTLVDPTPPQSLLMTGAAELSRRLSHWFSAAETSWYRHVIGYDQYVQRDALRRVGSSFSPRSLRPVARRAAPWILLVLAPWTLSLLHRRIRAWRERRPDSFFELAQRAVSRAGFSRQPWWTEREFAASVVAADPRLSALARLAELRYRERFRPGGLDPEELARARGMLEELRRALSHGPEGPRKA